MKHSRFHIVTLSKKSFEFYDSLACGRVLYLKTGVDVQKFIEADKEKKAALKCKYGLKDDRPVILHVGHLHSGRNVEALCGIEQDKQVILVVSSVSRQDLEIRKRLEEKGNIRIIDQYCPEIQEIYQLSDAYVFPVMQEENSIDVPLSVLEAAACNLPILATPYGELREFDGGKGILFQQTISEENIDEKLNQVLKLKDFDNREMVSPYDWESSSHMLEKWIEALS